MKALIPSLFLSVLFLLTGCSGKQTSSQLQITRGFAMANTTFPGGLIVTGKKVGSQQTFSVSLDGSTTVNLQLDSGVWIFAAVGWEGGSPMKNFGGDPLCGWIQKDLQNPQETIDLLITKANCTSSPETFAAGYVDSGATPQSIKKLTTVISCGSFFTSPPAAGDNPSSLAVSSGYPAAYCDSLPEYMQGRVQSFRIKSVNKLPSQILPGSGLDSGCINMNASSRVSSLGGTGRPYENEIGPRLPLKNIPFIIQTFEEADCSRLVTNFYFKNGIAPGDPADFDHFVDTDGSNGVRLLIPGDNLKRGKSAFLANLPYFKMFDTIAEPFKTLPTLSPGLDFYVVRNQSQDFIIETSSPCPITSPTGIDTPGCVDLPDGRRKITLHVTSGTGDTSGSFILGSNTYNVYVSGTAQSSQRYRTQKILLDTIGKPSEDDNFVRFFYAKHDEEAETYGILKNAREMIGSIGGLVGVTSSAATFTQACLDAVVTKELSIFESDIMRFKKYKVDISNTPISSPTRYMCDTTNRSVGTCSSSYDKRVVLYDYENSAIIPSMVFEFSCSKLIGRMEIAYSKIEFGSKYNHNMIVQWNTEPDSSLAHQRFEVLLKDQRRIYNSSTKKYDLLRDENRKMARVSKLNNFDFEIHHYDFGKHFDSATTSWRQNLDAHQIASQNTTLATNVCSKHNGGTLLDPDSQLIFSQAYADDAPVANVVGNIKYQANSSSFDPATTDCTSMTQFTSQLYADVDTNLSDDNFSDHIDEDLPFRLDTLNSSIFLNKFGTSFLTSPAQ